MNEHENELLRAFIEACRRNNQDPEARIGRILICTTYGGHK